jgi:hypothetical protein
LALRKIAKTFCAKFEILPFLILAGGFVRGTMAMNRRRTINRALPVP